MPQLTPEQMIETQRQDWNRVASGWERWDQFFDRNMTFLNHRLVADARLRRGHSVLDVGSGTGYPALLAAQVVGPDGHVVGIDLAERMLAVAGRKATKLGLSNIDFQTGDASKLPFESGRFNAVTTRFCLMFLPDVSKGLEELTRVLKGGGYLTAAVWSTPAKIRISAFHWIQSSNSSTCLRRIPTHRASSAWRSPGISQDWLRRRVCRLWPRRR